MEQYVCCFCGEPIERKVTALLAVTNWSESENGENEESQQLFCHLSCLKQAIQNPDHLYIEEE